MQLQPSTTALKAMNVYFQLRERQYKYYFNKVPLSISNKDFVSAYTELFSLVNNSQGQFGEDKKYEKYEITILNQYKNDITDFCKRSRELYKQCNTMEAQDEQNYVCNLMQNSVRFINWLAKIFRVIEKASLNIKSIYLINEGIKIFRSQFIDPLLQKEIFELCCKLLQLFKEQKLTSYEPLQEIIKILGSVGFVKSRHIMFEREDDGRYHIVSFNQTTKQHEQTPFETDYFKKYFANPLIQRLQRYYRVLTNQLIKLSAPQYISQVLHLLKKEEEAADLFYWNQKIKDHIIKSIEEVLIHQKSHELLSKENTGFFSMLQKKDITNLTKLHMLMKRSSNLKLLGKELQNYIDIRGNAILEKVSLEDQKNAKKQIVIGTINEIYELYENIDKITHTISAGDLQLQAAQNYAFQQVFNKTNKLTNFLAYYADYILRKQENIVDGNTEIINKVSKISTFLYSYDAFLKLYQKLLGLRILYDNFKNRQTEFSIINMLKNEAGASALNKITCMITDVKFSESFNQEKMSNQGLKFGFEVMLLTSGSWQIQDNKHGKSMVPPQLIEAVDTYEKIYSQWLPGRTITWLFNYGRAIVHAEFNESKHLLIVNNYQLLVLLYLKRNEWKKVKVNQLISEMKIDDEMSFISSIMMFVKTGILLKEGAVLKLENKHQKVWFNSDFKYKSTKVLCYQLPRHLEKVGQQNAQLVLQRSYLVDAAIVKVMKLRKVMQYSQLLVQVQKMNKTFKADVGLIKKRIENCQERQFIIRDEKDINCLIYKP